MSARQLVVPLNFRPGARPWRRVLPRKALQVIDARGGFIQSAIVEVESRFLCYRAGREPSPVSRDALIFSSLQYSVATLEIHPGSSDPGDHEIRAPRAVEDCTRADQRCAIDDPGLRFIELTLFVFNSRNQTGRQSRRKRIRPDSLLGDPKALSVMPICRRETYLPLLCKPFKAVAIDRSKYVPAILLVGEWDPWRRMEFPEVARLHIAEANDI